MIIWDISVLKYEIWRIFKYEAMKGVSENNVVFKTRYESAAGCTDALTQTNFNHQPVMECTIYRFL